MDITQMVISYLVTAILSAVIGFISTKLKNNVQEQKEKDEEEKKKIKTLENGVRALLKNELVQAYREFKDKGEISILDRENLEEMFKEYKELNGNGTLTKMMNELLNLKTKIE